MRRATQNGIPGIRAFRPASGVLLPAIVWFCLASILSGASVVFTQPEEPVVLSTEGHMSLRWQVEADETDAPVRFQLEHARSADFGDGRLVYEGRDRGTFVSGLRSGDNFYRLRAAVGEGAFGDWSETITIEVAYPSHGRVTLFIGIGISMLVILLISVVRGARSTTATS